MSLGEFSGYFVQEWPDLVFRKRHDPGDNPARSLGILVSERAQKNAGLVRAEDRGRAMDANRGGGDHGLAIPEKRGWKPQVFSTRALFAILPGTPRHRYDSFDRPEESSGESIALPALVDVGFYFLVPISRAATPTGRGAYCFFLNVGD